MTNEARIYTGKKTVSSVSCVGKAGHKSMVTTHPLALQENKLKVA